MADSIFLTFITPELSSSVHGILQLGFAMVFMAVLVITPLLVARTARDEQWQRRLDLIDKTGEPVAAHGTPKELGDAVATPAERWADVLPSLLLVFGLLGTFIGLGLALTEAANVLSSGQQAGGTPLDNLTPIMSSLGSKFKTSTWGILAFLSLKVLFMLRPYEEQRMAWAANKIRTNAAHTALQTQQQEAAERQRLIDTIVTSHGALLAQQLHAEGSAVQRHAASIEAQQDCTEHQVQAITQANAALLAEQQHVLQQASDQHAETTDTLKRMAEQQAHASAQLGGRIDLQIQCLEELKEHTAATRIAMDGFVHAVQGNIGTMATAANSMADAANAAGKASVGLGVVIDDFRNTMTSVLGDIKSGLGDSINAMQANFGTNMSAMSESLVRATSGIEAAISGLSSGVNDTIAMLQQASDVSTQLQLKAQASFSASGHELMTSLGSMQDYVQQMQTKIEAGLRSVSEAGLKITHATFKMSELLAASVTSNDRAEALVGNINGLSTEIRQLVAGVAGQQQSRDAVQVQLTQLGAHVSEMLGAQQKALQHDGNKQLVDTLERAARTWAQPSRVADESIERLVAALAQTPGIADETPA